MYNFILPGFYEKFNINSKLIYLKQQEPELFREDINFSAFFGNIGFNIWEGGRIFLSYKRAYRENLYTIKEFYENNNIPIRLTFTNPIISEEHLYDSYCNMIAEIFESGNNEILVVSPILENYLKEKYPNYKYCSSTTKCITNFNGIQEEIKRYYQVCLDYNLNNNKKLLDKFTKEEKQKIELLCNAICPPGCPNRKKHYELNGNYVLSGGQSYSIQCQITKDILDPQILQSKNNISPNQIILEYYPEGFNNFKLEGRTLPDITLISLYSYYLIKPEYQMSFFSKF